MDIRLDRKSLEWLIVGLERISKHTAADPEHALCCILTAAYSLNHSVSISVESPDSVTVSLPDDFVSIVQDACLAAVRYVERFKDKERPDRPDFQDMYASVNAAVSLVKKQLAI